VLVLVATLKSEGIDDFPTPLFFSVQSSWRTTRDDKKVHELIDPDTKEWNLSMLAEVFQEEEAWVI
jgi:hypothetical protein